MIAGVPLDYLLTLDGVTAFVIGIVAGALYVIVHWGDRPRHKDDD